MRSFMHNARRNRLRLIDERIDERVFAEQICDARNTSGIFVNRFHGLRRENGSSVSAADTKTFVYVSSHFFVGERLRSAPHGNALTQLAEPRIAQLFLKLRLTGQNNLQQ